MLSRTELTSTDRWYPSSCHIRACSPWKWKSNIVAQQLIVLQNNYKLYTWMCLRPQRMYMYVWIVLELDLHPHQVWTTFARRRKRMWKWKCWWWSIKWMYKRVYCQFRMSLWICWQWLYWLIVNRQVAYILAFLLYLYFTGCISRLIPWHLSHFVRVWTCKLEIKDSIDINQKSLLRRLMENVYSMINLHWNMQSFPYWLLYLTVVFPHKYTRNANENWKKKFIFFLKLWWESFSMHFIFPSCSCSFGWLGDALGWFSSRCGV